MLDSSFGSHLEDVPATTERDTTPRKSKGLDGEPCLRETSVTEEATAEVL